MKREPNETEIHTGSTVPDRYLCFSLNKEKYAIPLLSVKEVIGDCSTTPIPSSPTYFKGILNLRGQVISVIDLRRKLQIEPLKGAEQSIVIVDFDSLHLGFVVDSVDKVCAWERKDLSGPPDAPSSANQKFVAGVARDEDSITLLLDLEGVLSVEDFKAAKAQLKTVA